jgi:predicted RNA-binding protein with RPS1 domain
MREKNKTELEIQEKIASLRELETERLLLGDIVRTYTNTQSGYAKDITSYFAVRSGVDNTYIDEFAPKPKVSLSIETMKANIQKKEVEPPPIMSKMDSVKVAKAIRNVKESEKEAKKAEKESKKTADKSLSEVEKIAKSKIKRNNKLDIAIGSVLDL